jgi:hypothetical protein
MFVIEQEFKYFVRFIKLDEMRMFIRFPNMRPNKKGALGKAPHSSITIDQTYKAQN